MPYNCCPSKKGTFGGRDKQAQRGDYMRTQGECHVKTEGWSDGRASRGTPGATRCSERGVEQTVPQGFPKELHPMPPWFGASNLQKSEATNCFFKATLSVVLCYGSPRKLIHPFWWEDHRLRKNETFLCQAQHGSVVVYLSFICLMKWEWSLLKTKMHVSFLSKEERCWT